MGQGWAFSDPNTLPEARAFQPWECQRCAYFQVCTEANLKENTSTGKAPILRTFLLFGGFNNVSWNKLGQETVSFNSTEFFFIFISLPQWKLPWFSSINTYRAFTRFQTETQKNLVNFSRSNGWSVVWSISVPIQFDPKVQALNNHELCLYYACFLP